MKTLASFKILLFIFMILLTSCDKDQVEQIDNLEQTGVLGMYKLETRIVNGISSLAIECCDYIEFKTDSEPGDLKGVFRAFGVGYETNGVFELNPSTNTIQFEYNDTQTSYGFKSLEDVITFTYSEDNAEIIEYWRKNE
ncbi:MAG: hypothetical protein R6W85_02625 [Gillisia sp.]